MKLGIIARADKTGLGNQTRNLARMLNPAKIMIIDSTAFNKNQQYFETYKDYASFIINGFPSSTQVQYFLRGLDAVLTCELFYNNDFISLANARGVRTYNQFNYEFLDNLVNPRLLVPTKFLSPSKWMLEDMQQRFPNRVEYLPPPINHNDFAEVKHVNLSRSGRPRFLHVVGRQAVNDRNGTIDLLESLKYTKEDFELVLKVQTSSPVLEQYKSDKVTLDYSSPLNEVDLYRNFDALIFPRRYAGLSLPMNEALMSGLPVIMTDIEPNNLVLPKEWLAESQYMGTFTTRTDIPYYSAKKELLAQKIDWLCQTNLTKEKKKAFEIGYNNYSQEVLYPQYLRVLEYERS